MKNRIKFFQQSIFTRLIATFLMILLPLYLLSVGIHQWGVTIVRTEIINSVKSQMDYHKTVLQNEFNRIQNLENEFLIDEDLLKLANISQALSDYDKSQSMNRIQNRLYMLKNSSIYIEEAIVIIPSLNRTISADGGVRSISGEEMDTVSSFPDGNIIKLVNENNELYSRVRNVSLYNNQESIRFVLQIKFSNTMLENTFASFNVYEGSGSLLFYPDQNYVLSTDVDSPVTKQIESNIAGYGNDKNDYMESVSIANSKFFIFYQKLNYSNFWLVAYIPEAEVFSPLSKYMYILWIFTVVSIFIIVYFSFSTHKFLQRPLKTLVGAFKRVETGDLKFSVQHNTNDEFQYLYTRFNAMLDYINNLIDQVYTQKIMNQNAELKQLQSQINPHFLYNSFFIMQRMIQGDDNENAIRFCGFLGQYFRYVTRNAQDEMPLDKEVEHARNYLEIQAIRFSNTIIVFEELPSKYKEMLVPRLILQPIIENAFEYGLSKSVVQPMIAVRFTEAVEGLYITVEDNGNNADDTELQRLNQALSADDGKEAESTGLVNVNKRIKSKFGNNSGITLSLGAQGGWTVVVFFETGEGKECTGF